MSEENKRTIKTMINNKFVKTVVLPVGFLTVITVVLLFGSFISYRDPDIIIIPTVNPTTNITMSTTPSVVITTLIWRANPETIIKELTEVFSKQPVTNSNTSVNCSILNPNFISPNTINATGVGQQATWELSDVTIKLVIVPSTFHGEHCIINTTTHEELCEHAALDHTGVNNQYHGQHYDNYPTSNNNYTAWIIITENTHVDPSRITMLHTIIENLF